MGLRDYDAAFSEIAAVIKESGHRQVPALACDTQTSELQMISKVSDFKMIGGGGTDMGRGIRSAADDHKMRLVILCTDGETPYGDKIDGVRVIVCLTRPASKNYPVPPWMTVVEAFDK